MRLEVVVLPVADVERAKAFYAVLGWRFDADFTADDGLRVVQFTPPGSGCSVIFGVDVTNAQPGTVDGLVLTVDDIVAARADLVDRGVEVSDIFHDAGGVYHHADGGRRLPGLAPERQSYGSWATFADPDGNTWALQEISARLPGR